MMKKDIYFLFFCCFMLALFAVILCIFCERNKPFYHSAVKVGGGTGVVLKSEYDEDMGAYKNYALTCHHCVKPEIFVNTKIPLPRLPEFVVIQLDVKVYVKNFSKNQTVTSSFIYDASIEKVDEDLDFAIVSFYTPNKLQTIQYTKQCTIGEKCKAVGFPINKTFWLSEGIISCVEDYKIGTDCAINPGNSGGMIVNQNNQLLGIAHSVEGYYNQEGVPLRGDGLAYFIHVKHIVESLTSEELKEYF